MGRKNKTSLMTTLAVVTAFSRTYAATCLAIQHRELGKGIFITPQKDSYQSMKSMGLSPILLDVETHQTWTERDAHFASVAMPGSMEFGFEGTNLPVWKVMSIDRLYFWFRGKSVFRAIEAIEALSFDKLLVSLDIHSPLPWALANLHPAVAVQCGSILSREFSDLAPYLPFDKILVRDEISAKFLKKCGTKEDKILQASEDFPVPNEVDKKQRDKIREGLGIDPTRKVVATIYDSQTEWALRRWLQAVSSSMTPQTLIIVVKNKYQRKQLYSLCCKLFSGITFLVVEDQSLIYVADELVCFRLDEEMSRSINIPIKIMDVQDRFLSKEVLS